MDNEQILAELKAFMEDLEQRAEKRLDAKMEDLETRIELEVAAVRIERPPIGERLRESRDESLYQRFEAHADEIERRLGQIVTRLEAIAALSTPRAPKHQDGPTTEKS